jgi:hypothetical protein
MTCGWKEIRDPLMDGVLDAAGSTAQFPFKNLLFVLLVDMECQISLADRTAENIHQ